MPDPGSLLATLAQSSAAIVAIVGGFLVSRLVALSSEREGLRRQLVAVREQLVEVRPRYDEAHEYRFENSMADFTDWVLPKILESDDTPDLEELLGGFIPRGSSMDEMRPVLEDLVLRVANARSQVIAVVREGDTSAITLDDLVGRGLEVDEDERDIYVQVLDRVKESLPSPRWYGVGSIAALDISSFYSPVDRVTDMRRLDDSIREEQQLGYEVRTLEAEEQRIVREVEAIGRPAGVVSAIVILAAYSVLGILVPVAVMASDPNRLAGWQSALLVSLFAVGLFAVLGYILWYSRNLGAPIEETTGESRPDAVSGPVEPEAAA